MSDSYVTVVALGDDGNVERRYRTRGTTPAKLDELREWTAAAYEQTYGHRPRVVNLSDFPYVEGLDYPPVHGVEGATYRHA